MSVVWSYPALGPTHTTNPIVGFNYMMDGVFYHEINPSFEHPK